MIRGQVLFFLPSETTASESSRPLELERPQTSLLHSFISQKQQQRLKGDKCLVSGTKPLSSWGNINTQLFWFMVQGSFHIRKSLQRCLRYKIFVFFSNVLNIVFYVWTNSITRTIFLNCAIKRDILQVSPSLFPKGYLSNWSNVYFMYL